MVGFIGDERESKYKWWSDPWHWGHVACLYEMVTMWFGW